MGQRGPCLPLPSGGVDKGRGASGHRDAGQIAHPGGPEYALHSADGAQSGGNDPHSHPQCTSLASIPAPVSALPNPPGAEWGEQACSEWDRDRWFCIPCLGCYVDQPQYCQSERSIDNRVLSSHLCMEALWKGVNVCFGARALSGMGSKEEFNVREVCRKDMAFLEKGKGP